ncbi:Phage replication protein [Clostridiaceae bacterium JG1575]|nr:Phage replication protein [Clostridiaceae bacterium JG1575]
MAVFRVERNKGYTVMSNHHLRNKELSLKAKGLLSQMLSLPENWDYTLAGLSHINRESIDATRTAVWEVERAGYNRRSQSRDANGKMAEMVYTIYGQPMLENPTSDNPVSENPTQLNREIQTKDPKNKDGSIIDSIPFRTSASFPLERAAAPPEEKRKEMNDAYKVYEEIIKDNIEYSFLLQDKKIDRDRLNEIVDLILETVCSQGKKSVLQATITQRNW